MNLYNTEKYLLGEQLSNLNYFGNYFDNLDFEELVVLEGFEHLLDKEVEGVEYEYNLLEDNICEL